MMSFTETSQLLQKAPSLAHAGWICFSFYPWFGASKSSSRWLPFPLFVWWVPTTNGHPLFVGSDFLM